jgi:hypothetical protein
MPLVPPQPPSPLRYPPRSTDHSSLSRSLVRPRQAEQGGSDDRDKGWRRISLDTTVSAPPKTLGRLAYHRYPRRWRLSSHADSWGERGPHDFGYWLYPRMQGLQADWHIRGSCPAYAAKRAGTIQSADIQQAQAVLWKSLSWSCRLESAQIRACKTNTKRAAASRETHQAPDASFARGAARQQPGYLVARQFRELLYAAAQEAKSHFISTCEQFLALGSVIVRRRGSSKALKAGWARILANSRQIWGGHWRRRGSAASKFERGDRRMNLSWGVAHEVSLG